MRTIQSIATISILGMLALQGTSEASEWAVTRGMKVRVRTRPGVERSSVVTTNAAQAEMCASEIGRRAGAGAPAANDEASSS